MGDRIHVAVRVRKLIHREKNGKEIVQWEVQGKNTLTQIDKNGLPVGEIPFVFDRVFNPNETTADVYEELCKPIVKSVMEGFNGTIFAYGQTSSGKTYTMRGDEKDHGIVVHTIAEIFEAIENTPDREFLLRLSYMEIYNEKISDLLAEKQTALKIKENMDGQVLVDQLKEEMVKSAEDVMMVMQKGEARRHCGETCMNEKSSRSHAIFRMIIESRPVQVGPNVAAIVHVSHLNLVDLAGSERTGQMGTTGDRFKEGVNINKSLLMLGHVISKLSEGEGSFVSFRESKLTRILQNSLGGNAKTAIICTVTPVSLEQTRSTLNFAGRAKKIKNQPVVNEILSDGALLNLQQKQIRKLELEMQEMRKCDKQSQVDAMQKELQEKERQIKVLQDRYDYLKTHVLVSSRALDETNQPLKRKNRRETWCAPVRGKYKSIVGAPAPFMTTLYESDEQKARLSSTFEETTLKEGPENNLDYLETSFHTQDFRDSSEFLAEMNRISDHIEQDKNFSQIDMRRQQEQVPAILALGKKVKELEKQINICEDSKKNMKIESENEARKQKEQLQVISDLEKKVSELENKLIIGDDSKRNMKIELQNEAGKQKEQLEIISDLEKKVSELENKLIICEDSKKNMKIESQIEARKQEDQLQIISDLEKKVSELENKLIVCDGGNKEMQIQLKELHEFTTLERQVYGEQPKNVFEQLKFLEKTNKDTQLLLQDANKQIRELQVQKQSAHDELEKERERIRGENVQLIHKNKEIQLNYESQVKKLLEMEEKMKYVEQDKKDMKDYLESKWRFRETDLCKQLEKAYSDLSKWEKEGPCSSQRILEYESNLKNLKDELLTCEKVKEELQEIVSLNHLKMEFQKETFSLEDAVSKKESLIDSQSDRVASTQTSFMQNVDITCKMETEEIKHAAGLIEELLMQFKGLSQMIKSESENRNGNCKTLARVESSDISDKEVTIDVEEDLIRTETGCVPIEMSKEKESNLAEPSVSGITGLNSVLQAQSAQLGSFHRDMSLLQDVLLNAKEECTKLATEKEKLVSSIVVAEFTNKNLEDQLVSLKKRECELLDSVTELETIAKSKTSSYCDKCNQIDDKVTDVPVFETVSGLLSKLESEDIANSNVNLNLVDDEVMSLKSRVTKYESEIEEFQTRLTYEKSQYQNILQDMSSRECCISQLQKDNNLLVTKHHQLSEDLESVKKALSGTMSEKDALHRELLEVNLMKDDLTQQHSTVQAELSDLKEKVQKEIAKLLSSDEEKDLLQKKCVQLENESKIKDENLSQSQLDRNLLVDENQQLLKGLQSEKDNLLHALLENDETKKHLVEIRLEKDDVNRRCLSLTSEMHGLKESLKNSEEKAQLLEVQNKKLQQKCSRLGEEDKYKAEVERLGNELQSRINDESSVNHLQQSNQLLAETNNKLSEELQKDKKALLDALVEIEALQQTMVEAKIEKDNLGQQLVSVTQNLNDLLKNAEEESLTLAEGKHILQYRCSKLEDEIECKSKEIEKQEQELISKERHLQELGKKLECVLEESEQRKLEIADKTGLLKVLEDNIESKAKIIDFQMEQIMTKENEIQEKTSQLESASQKVSELTQQLTEMIRENERLENLIKSKAMTSETFGQRFLEKENELAKLQKQFETALFDLEQLRTENSSKDHTLGELQAKIQKEIKCQVALKERINDEENELQAMRKRMDVASNELCDLKEDLQGKVMNIDILQKDIQRHQNTVKVMKESLYDKENTILDLNRKLGISSEQCQQLQEEADKLRLIVKDLQQSSEQIQLLKEENKSLCSKLKEEEEAQAELKEDFFNLQTELLGNRMWEREAVSLQKQLDEQKAKESAILKSNPDVEALRQKCADLQKEKDSIHIDAELVRQKNEKLRLVVKDLQSSSEQFQLLKEENKNLCSKLKEEEESQAELKEDFFNLQTLLLGNRMWEREAVSLQKQLDELKAKESALLKPNPDVDALRQKYADLQKEKDTIHNDAQLVRQKYEILKEHYSSVWATKKRLESTVEVVGGVLWRERSSAGVQTEEYYPLEEGLVALQNEVSMLQQKLVEKERRLAMQEKDLESQYFHKLHEKLEEKRKQLPSEKENLMNASNSPCENCKKLYLQQGEVSASSGRSDMEGIPKRTFAQNIEVQKETETCENKTIASLRKRLLEQEIEIAEEKTSKLLLRQQIKNRRAQKKNQADSGSIDTTPDENWDLIEYGGSGFINRLQVCEMSGAVKRLQKENKKLKEKCLKLEQSKENIPIQSTPLPTVSRSKALPEENVPMTSNQRSATHVLTPLTDNQISTCAAPTLQDDVTLTVLERPRLTVFRKAPVEKKKEDDNCTQQ